MTTNAQDKERTFFELKEVKKIDSLDHSKEKGHFYKQKEVIRAYHHIIKKILPPYVDDQTTVGSELLIESEDVKKEYNPKGSMREENSQQKFLKNADAQKSEHKREPYSKEHLLKAEKKRNYLKSKEKNEKFSNSINLKRTLLNKKRHTKYREYKLHRRQRSIDVDNKQQSYSKAYEMAHQPFTFLNSFVSNTTYGSVNNSEEHWNLKRDKHDLLKVHEGISHLSRNISRIVIVKQGTKSNETTESSPNPPIHIHATFMKEHWPELHFNDSKNFTLVEQSSKDNEANKSTLKPPIQIHASFVKEHWPELYSKDFNNFTSKANTSDKKFFDYHVIWHPTKLITDYLPLTSVPILTPATRKWYSPTSGWYTAASKWYTTTGKLLPITRKQYPSTGRLIPTQDRWFTTFSRVGFTTSNPEPITGKWDLSGETLNSADENWYSTDRKWIPPKDKWFSTTSSTSKMKTYSEKWYPTAPKPNLSILRPIIASTSNNVKIAVKPPSYSTTTEINLDELIHLIDSYLPEGELELLTNEIKLKNEIIAFQPAQGSNISVHADCTESPDQVKKIKLLSLSVWLVSTFCLLIIVAMAFLIYTTKLKDGTCEMPYIHEAAGKGTRLFNAFIGKNGTKATVIKESDTISDRQKADINTLREIVQKALNSCRFYQVRELLRMYSTLEHMKSMLHAKKDLKSNEYSGNP